MRNVRVALMSLTALALAAGCSAGSAPSKATGAVTPSSTAPSTAAPAPSSGGSLVALTLTAAEATDAGGIPVQEELAPSGDAVSGPDSSTLDLCGHAFPSEALRVARHQVLYYDAQDAQRVDESNEVVRYRSGGAAQAYAEVQAVAKDCPGTNSLGVTTSKVVVAPRSPQLVDDQLTVSFSLTRQGATVYSAAVYQYVGDLFSGTYTFRPSQAAALRSAVALAAVSARKLQRGTTV